MCIRDRSNGNPDLRPAQTKDFTYFGWNPNVNSFRFRTTAFFNHDVNWGSLWAQNDIGPDGQGDGGINLQTDSRVTFDTGVDQTLGGYVHIKIDCGTSRSQLIPGNAGGGFVKDGDYYEFYQTTERQRDGWIVWPFIRRYKTVVTAEGYRITDGGEPYFTSMPFVAEIELIFKMYAPATNTFASNAQGTNLWATTLPGTASD